MRAKCGFVISGFVLVMLLLTIFVGWFYAALALDYQTEFDLQFTFDPTVSIGIIGPGLSIDNLTAGHSADSSVVTITAGSNDVNGYTVYANMGDSTHNYTDFRISSGDSVNVFSAATAVSLASMESGRWGYSYSVDDGEHWGYGNIGGSTATTGGYGVLPLFNGSSHTGDVVLADTNNANSSMIKFKIGAKAANNQMPGTYSNVINFIGVAKVSTTSYTLNYNANGSSVTNMPTTPVSGTTSFARPLVTLEDKIPVRSGYTFVGWCDEATNDGTCSGVVTQPGRTYKLDVSSASVTVNLYAMWSNFIQDFTLDKCMVNVGTNGNPANVGDNIVVYDKRIANYPTGDDGSYTVRYINGQCWMTQNLRISGSISADDSNFSGADFNVSEYDLKTDGADECSGSGSPAPGLTHVCSHVADASDVSYVGGTATSGNLGAWYNYCAASAGTICSDAANVAATSDICPAGWHLPSGPSTTAGRDFSNLAGNTTSGWQAATAGITAFGVVYGGDYNNGTLNSTFNARWWSATSQGTTSRPTLFYNNNNNNFIGNYNYERYYGYFIRCVRM